jgi:hypothetical protein
MAAMWGKAVGYTDDRYTITIETSDGRVMVVNREVFDCLYCRLDPFTAALREDCIEYVTYDVNKPILEYPEWYINAVRDGQICNDGYSTPRSPNGNYIFYDVKVGEIPMSPTSVILRNYMGDLMYMEIGSFTQIYDIVGE